MRRTRSGIILLERRINTNWALSSAIVPADRIIIEKKLRGVNIARYGAKMIVNARSVPGKNGIYWFLMHNLALDWKNRKWVIIWISRQKLQIREGERSQNGLHRRSAPKHSLTKSSLHLEGAPE